MVNLLSHDFLCDLIREGVEQRTGHGTLAEILTEGVDDTGGGGIFRKSVHLVAAGVDSDLLVHQEVGIITLVCLFDESVLPEGFDLLFNVDIVARTVVERGFDALLVVEEDTDEVATSDVLVDTQEHIGADGSLFVGVEGPHATGLLLGDGSTVSTERIAITTIGDPNAVEDIDAVRLAEFASDLHGSDDRLVEGSTTEVQHTGHVVVVVVVTNTHEEFTHTIEVRLLHLVGEEFDEREVAETHGTGFRLSSSMPQWFWLAESPKHIFSPRV